ncbi:MAG: hypothetical protein RLZ56_1028 [Bacteroidota bacterium]|jgi:hypothetical protein
MNELGIYIHLGFKHIIEWGAWDHILFVWVLALRYQWIDWKKLLILITAFTIGHSITLALSTLNWIDFPSQWIETLIPTTILITAISNFWVKNFDFQSKYPVIYFFALFFGLIHGLGFSTYLKSLLGKETSIFGPLFTFNIGLELGQLLVVGVILIISFIFVSVFRVNRLRYLQIGSAIAMLFASNMVIDRVVSFIK